MTEREGEEKERRGRESPTEGEREGKREGEREGEGEGERGQDNI